MLCGWFITGCGGEHAVSSSLAPSEKAALTAALSACEMTMEDKAPELFANLAPPATPAELDDLAAGMGGARVEALEIWFTWHNGEKHPTMTEFPMLGYPLSIAETLEKRQMERSIPLIDRIRRNAVHLIHDGSGDGYFLDVTRDPPRVFYHMLEDPYPEDFGTLTEFVGFLEAVCAEGFDDGEDMDAWRAEFDRYLEIQDTYLTKIRR